MNFQLTEEHLAVQQAARDFAQTELLPGACSRRAAPRHRRGGRWPPCRPLRGRPSNSMFSLCDHSLC